MATDIKSGTMITADGDYDLKVKPGLYYGLSLVFSAGSADATVSEGYQTVRGRKFQQQQLPNSTSTMVISETATIRKVGIDVTGDTLRLSIANASSLELFPILIERAGRNQ
jgi:hypothetical protein